MAARRASRGMFGIVLLLGAVAMFAIPAHAATIVIATWCVACCVAGLTRLLARSREQDDELAAFGLAVPLVGIALIGPLSLHLAVALALDSTAGFGKWVVASALGTGFAHLCFATFSAVYGWQLAADRPRLTPRRIYLCTLLASLVPVGLVFPPVPGIVALTGLPFLWVLRAFERLAERERAELARPRLPVAIARSL